MTTTTTTTLRRPRPPKSGDVSAVLAYLRALEQYATALEAIIRKEANKP